MDDCEKIIRLIYNDNVSELRRLLASGVDPNCRDQTNWTPLHWAAQEGRLKVAKCLLDVGADAEARDNGGITPLHLAVGEQHIKIASELLKRGASPNTRVKSNNNSSVLHLACAWGYFDMVELLTNIESIDLNLRDDEGHSPLFFAKNGGFAKIADYLIQRGAVE